MVNSILDAVTAQLGKTFGTSYHYYVENVEQNLSPKSFTVDTILPTMRSRSPTLYDRQVPIVIHYFSDDKNNLKKDCYSMAERIIECLEYLPYKSTLLRGEDISWQLSENVLQVFITYDFTTMVDKEDEDKMEDLFETVTHT